MNARDLEQKLEKRREYIRIRLKKHYKIAREIGFCSQEAAILSHQTLKVIHRIALERGLNVRETL